MRTELGIGTRSQTIEIDDAELIEVMHANAVEAEKPGEGLVRDALSSPVGTARLKDIVHPGQKVCLIASDCTRPCPTPELLTPVMQELHEAGIPDKDVFVAIALGSHRPQTEEELAHIMGPWKGKLAVVNGSTSFRHFGTTKAGTPVDIIEEVADADVRVGLGNVEYHYFAGYSGGAKAIMPGCSTFEAIQANHSLMLSPEAHAGNMESPVRLDLEEACRMVGLDFIVNVVLDEDRHIVYAAAGDFVAAQRDACRHLDDLYGCELHEEADIVVVSQGGSPKDLNLYQLQKALDNAKHPVRDGGTIVLVGSCQEGFGQPTFEQWMREAATPHEVVERLKKTFVLGGHKAAAVAQIEERCDIYLVSDMPDAEVRAAFMTPFATAQEALDAARAKTLRELGRAPRILVMPHGGSTLPLMRL